jgi:hypothetical protein
VCTVLAAGPIKSLAPFPLLSYNNETLASGSLIIFDAQNGKQIAAVKAGKRFVAWSPDSKRVCYIPFSGSQAHDYLLRYTDIKARDITIMDADGKNPITIFDCNPEGYLNWHP